MGNFRFRTMQAISEALPAVRTEEQQEAAIEALLCVAATSYLAMRRLPFTQEAVGAMATEAREALERYADDNHVN